jgi:threonine synthase
VVTAKTLTEMDAKLLNSYTESVWTKGGFDTRQLVEHVVQMLGHTPARTETTETALMPVYESERVEPRQDAPTVVIIEDNPQDLRLARRLLESQGTYRVIEASSGRAGLKAIYEYRPELIILDLMLPEMDGFSVLQTLQNDAKLREIPVVIVSAKELTPQERAEMGPYISSVITKAAFDRGQFLYTINSILK